MLKNKKQIELFFLRPSTLFWQPLPTYRHHFLYKLPYNGQSAEANHQSIAYEQPYTQSSYSSDVPESTFQEDPS